MSSNNGVRALAVTFLLLSACGVAAAQQAQPTTRPPAQAQSTPQPSQQAQPTAHPTQQSQPTGQATEETQPSAQPSPQTSPAGEEQPYLGVRLEDTPGGVVVRVVMPDSPAAEAGLQVDDVIQKINNDSISNVAQAAAAIQALQPGAAVTLDIMRADESMSLNSTLRSTHRATGFDLLADMPFDAIGYDDEAWHVFSISQASPLYIAGMRAGDNITQFDGKPYDPAALRLYRDDLADDANVALKIDRNGQMMDMAVPAASLKALGLFGDTNEGLLFGLASSTPNVRGLEGATSFDAFGYNSADTSWYVFGLAADSALYNAGLRAGDRISIINGTPRNPTSLRALRERLADDASLTLDVQRGDQTMQISGFGADLNVLALFANQGNGILFGLPETRGRVWLGADIVPLNSEVAQEHNVTADHGALVLGIMPDSPAASAGLQPNDIITRIGDDQVDTGHSLSSLLSEYKPGDQVTLDVLRGSNHVDVEATLAQPEVTGELPTMMGTF